MTPPLDPASFRPLAARVRPAPGTTLVLLVCALGAAPGLAWSARSDHATNPHANAGRAHAAAVVARTPAASVARVANASVPAAASFASVASAANPADVTTVARAAGVTTAASLPSTTGYPPFDASTIWQISYERNGVPITQTYPAGSFDYAMMADLAQQPDVSNLRLESQGSYGYGVHINDYTPAVPEESSLALCALGLVLWGARGWRRLRSAGLGESATPPLRASQPLPAVPRHAPG